MTPSSPNPSLGLESGVVRVVPYDSQWPELYATEVARLQPILSAHRIYLPMEHMGSTAVPGLSAKPIIDILAGVSSDTDRATAIRALGRAGYEHRGESGIAGRDFFRRGAPRAYHIHLVEQGGTFWREHLAFRDSLREHPDVMREYDALKQSLAERYPRDREAYIEGKTAFVRAVVARATE